MSTKKGVSIPGKAYEEALAAAQAEDTSLSNWISQAIRQRRAREASRQAAAFVARPEVAAELSGWSTVTAWPTA